MTFSCLLVLRVSNKGCLTLIICLIFLLFVNKTNPEVFISLIFFCLIKKMLLWLLIIGWAQLSIIGKLLFGFHSELNVLIFIQGSILCCDSILATALSSNNKRIFPKFCLALGFTHSIWFFLIFLFGMRGCRKSVFVLQKQISIIRYIYGINYCGCARCTYLCLLVMAICSATLALVNPLSFIWPNALSHVPLVLILDLLLHSCNLWLNLLLVITEILTVLRTLSVGIRQMRG